MSDNYTEPKNNPAAGAGDDDKNQEIMKRLSQFLGENNFTDDSLQKDGANVAQDGVRIQTSAEAQPDAAQFEEVTGASNETTTPTADESQATPASVDDFNDSDDDAPNAPTPEVPVADVEVEAQNPEGDANAAEDKVTQLVGGDTIDNTVNTMTEKLTSIKDIQQYLDTFEVAGRTLTQDQLSQLRNNMLPKTDSVIDNVLNSAMSQVEMASSDNAKTKIIEETAKSLRSFTVVLTPEQRTRIETFRDNIVKQIESKNAPIGAAAVAGDSVTEKIIDKANNNKKSGDKKRKLSPWFKWLMTLLLALGIGATAYFVFTAFSNNSQEIVKSVDSSSKKTVKKDSSDMEKADEAEDEIEASATSTPNGYTVGSLINVEYEGELVQFQILDITTTGIVAHSNYLNQDVELSFADYPYI